MSKYSEEDIDRDFHDIDPGFSAVMQNLAYNPATPFRAIPTFGDRPITVKSFSIQFSEEAAERFAELADRYGFDSSVDFINTAISVYGQMLAAGDEGYAQVVLLNPNTQEIIPVSLTRNGM